VLESGAEVKEEVECCGIADGVRAGGKVSLDEGLQLSWIHSS
jgi:hypothetical protein